MIALYIPMQPSSKTPMMAFSRMSWAASAPPRSTSGPSPRSSRSRTWPVSWTTLPVSSQVLSPSRAQSSVKSSLHSAEWATPALVRLPIRFSIPTRPGHWPLQFATTRIGPRWLRRPASTWWLYCHTASTTTTGASGGMALNTSIPIRWPSMKPCPFAASTGWARRTRRPSASTAAAKSRSSCSCTGQHVTLALGRTSPLATV